MLITGLSSVIFELFFAPTFSFRFVVYPSVLAVLGTYLIWTDFIAPRFGIKTWEDG
jgi:hypothetical protein